MKKILNSLILIISILSLSSCGSDGIGGTGSPVATSPSLINDATPPLLKKVSQVDIPFEDQGYSNFETTIISSQSQFDAFIASVKAQKNWDNKDDFLKRIQAKPFDFADNNLLLYRFTESSDTIQLTPQDPVIENNKITIKITRQDKAQSKSTNLPPVYRTLGKIGITNYALAYEVENSVKEILFKNGKNETSVKIKTEKTSLTKKQKSAISKLFDKGTTIFTGIVIDKDGSNDLSIGDIVKLSTGGVAGTIPQDHVLTANDIKKIKKQIAASTEGSTEGANSGEDTKEGDTSGEGPAGNTNSGEGPAGNTNSGEDTDTTKGGDNPSEGSTDVTDAKGISKLVIPFREHGYSNFETTVITTEAEFNTFISQVKSQENWNDKDKFLKPIQSEDFDFTKENLLLARITEGSGSIKLTPHTPTLKNGIVHVIIDKNTPETGTADIANYLLAYKVNKIIKEIVIVEGNKQTHIKLISTNTDIAVPPDTDKQLKLSATERKGLFKLFGLNATTSSNAGIRVIDNNKDGKISEGDTAILSRGGPSNVSQQSKTLSAKDIATLSGSNNTGSNVTETKSKLILTDESKLTAYFRDAIIKRNVKTGGDIALADSGVEFNYSTAAPATVEATGAGVSSTNIQEKGVDEADLIKTSSDGHYIFSIKKPDFSTYKPFIDPVFSDSTVKRAAFPQPATATYTPSDTISIIDTLSTDGITEIKQLVTTDKKKPWNISGLYLHETSNQLVALSSEHHNYWGHWFDGYYFANQQTDLLLIDIKDPRQATVQSELHFDGQLIDSRRNGDTLYMVLRHYPDYRVLNEETIKTSTAEDFLPKYSTNNQDKQLLVKPADCYQETNSKKITADIITLVAIDLSSDSRAPTINSQCYVGSAEAIYASQNALYLATTQWDYQVIGNAVKYSNPGITTDIHKFAYDGLDFEYRGSGEVKGHLGYKQDGKSFRFSEYEGMLRVVTFDEQMWVNILPVDTIEFTPVLDNTEGSNSTASPSQETKSDSPQAKGTQAKTVTAVPVRIHEQRQQSPVSISILKEDEDKSVAALRVISRLPNANRPDPIGLPGERLYATRFIGERGYIVTFRVTDPLYILDLSDPEDPFIAGELKIDGYSEYLHPVSESLILGVGKNAVPSSSFGDGRGAWYQGVKLSLIDISDPAKPSEVDKIIIGKRGTQSAALTNHHALTGMRVDDQYRLAIPVQLHDDIPQYGTEITPSTYYSYQHTGLYRFEIDIDHQQFAKKGAMIVDKSQTTPNQRFQDDRSIFIGENVYYMHNGQFWMQDWAGSKPLVGPEVKDKPPVEQPVPAEDPVPVEQPSPVDPEQLPDGQLSLSPLQFHAIKYLFDQTPDEDVRNGLTTRYTGITIDNDGNAKLSIGDAIELNDTGGIAGIDKTRTYTLTSKDMEAIDKFINSKITTPL